MAALHQATLFTTVCTVAMTVERYELVLKGLALLTMYPAVLPSPLQQAGPSTTTAVSPSRPDSAKDPLKPTPLMVLQKYAGNTDGPRVDLLLRQAGYVKSLFLTRKFLWSW